MVKRAFCTWAMIAGLMTGLTTSSAQAVTVDAFANSSTGGIGSATGVFLTAGQTFTVTVASNDLWSAGALPRWSNANGLIGDFYATSGDESGEAAGTLIGTSFGSWTQGTLSAPFGSLVGKIGAGAFFLVGTNFSGIANASGQLSLYYWDSNNFDNKGFISANIAAVPGPIVGAGLPSIIMALGGLVVLSRRRRNRPGRS